jgi:hypothetical protein
VIAIALEQLWCVFKLYSVISKLSCGRCYSRGPGGGSDKSRLEVHNRQGEDEAGAEAWIPTRAGRGRGQNKSVDLEAVQEANPILELRYKRRETEIR